MSTRSSLTGGCVCALALLASAACAPRAGVAPVGPPAEPPVTDGVGVLRAMHARYVGKFFTTLSFKQHTTTISTSGRETRGIWNEYLALPGRLRIDFQPLTTHSGVLYTQGKVHNFIDGKAQPVQAGWNPALALIGDVYVQPVDTTAWQLDSLGFDLGVLHETTWQGHRTWVVGAPAGDSTTSQFWIDRDSLLVRRILQRDARGARPVVTELRFDGYIDVSGYPVSFDVRFYRDGRMYFKEEYFEVKANVPIPPETFDPAKWRTSQLK
jgi:hypothetical protein